ncbi:MAG: PEP-CTERM sorting domain-containing protein [Crocosphaera sp.]|nr:PEP-CTERM sorting domain-containing protein [Crocosphaera sp.]
MLSKSLTTLTTASIAALTLATNTQAAELTVLGVLDPFDVDQSAFNEAGQSQIGPTTAIIAPFETSILPLFPLQRIIEGEITAGSTALPGSVQADSNISVPGSFSVGNDPNRESEISVFYTSPIPDLPEEFNIIDFTVGGEADRLIVNVTANDLPMFIDFMFRDIFGGFGFVSLETPGGITASNPTTLIALFSEAEFFGIDFSAITQFSFDVSTQSDFPAADITFDFFSVGTEITTVTTTPEPGTILSLMAVSGLGLVSRRRQTKT